MGIETIVSIEVTHVPNEFGTPAHIRVMGVTPEGQFTIRKISGLRTDRIEKKMEEARNLYSRLVGCDVKVIERPFHRGRNQTPSIKRVVNHTSLPDWARGDWKKVSSST